MIFFATEVSCNELKYEILRKEINGIKIVEINKENSPHHDFVLINYPVTQEALEEVKKLNTIYKKQQNTICFIGCADGNDVLFDLDDYLNLSFQSSTFYRKSYLFNNAISE